MYNMTNVTNANNAYEIVKATNDISGGLIFAMLMFVLFLVILITFRKRNFKAVLVGASFITSIVAVIGLALKFIGWNIVIIPILLFFASLLIYMFVPD